MRFGSGDNSDPSQIEDRRGQGLGGPLLLGGGGLGVGGLILYMVLQLMAGPNHRAPEQPADHPSGSAAQTAQLGGSCEGAHSQGDQGKFVSCVVSDVQRFWQRELGQRYEPAHLVLFEQATQSGCGTASSETGPFYCTRDNKVYLDLGFFNELSERFGAKGGDFAEAYVVAHEYGHHIQDLLGIQQRLGQARSREEQNALSVRLELQADCFAGVWGHAAFQKGTVGREEIAQGLDAAAAVGDDRIQRAATGRVEPERFTHGSAAERQRWFSVGLETGDPNACDTFSR